jgi:isopenicillin-N epimerase
MNEIASGFPLSPGDEVLLNDHEYGAVRRIWARRCEACRATAQIAALPPVIESAEHVIDAIFARVTPRTRLIVVSHITSPTAMTLPIAAIVRRAAGLGIPVCVDGPHAVAQLPLDLSRLQCDFFTASCHKWLSAPFGSGFLYVDPKWHAGLRPTRLSWGRIPPAEITCWSDEFIWSGTRDPSAYLAVPAAIEFLEQIGSEAFRRRTQALAAYARQTLGRFGGGPPLVRDDAGWYASMAHVPLPDGDARGLQAQLWQQYGIEVPVIDFRQRRFIRVSCHLYNRRSDIDRLAEALSILL